MVRSIDDGPAALMAFILSFRVICNYILALMGLRFGSEPQFETKLFGPLTAAINQNVKQEAQMS